MRRTADHLQRLRQPALQHQLLAAQHIECQPDLGRLLDHPIGDLMRAAHLHVEIDARVRRAEARHQPGQEIPGHGLDHRQPDRTAPQAGQVVEIGADTLDAMVAVADELKQHPSGLGRQHAARRTLEQRRAQFLLQVHDLTADGAGGDEEEFGRPAQGAGADDFGEIAKGLGLEHGGWEVAVSGRMIAHPSPAGLASRSPRTSYTIRLDGRSLRTDSRGRSSSVAISAVVCDLMMRHKLF